MDFSCASMATKDKCRSFNDRLTIFNGHYMNKKNSASGDSSLDFFEEFSHLD